MDKNKSLKVGIQGIQGSFHEMAALAYFGEEKQIVECMTFQALCDALEHGVCDIAVMAIENSIAGSILPNYFLLQDYHFSIVGELYFPIHLHLMGLPGVQIKNIKNIESHPMAIRQCVDYLRLFSDVDIHESNDTAWSAKRISELQLKDWAAIGNELAAEKYGLEILDRRIETHKKNFTRFLILSKDKGDSKSADKATLSFEVANKVGSLADILMVFKNHHINLSKIQSIPIIGKPSQYSIHIDLEWEDRTKYDLAMKQALMEVRNLNVLGEYHRGKIEYQ